MLYSVTQVSVVIPAYNESDSLKSRIQSVLGQDEVSEVVVVEDGCTDDTPQICSELEEKLSNVKHVHFDSRQGKGQALLSGFKECSEDRLAFLDADQSIEASAISDLCQSLSEGADLAVGLRDGEDTSDSRRLQRKLLSHAYNLLADAMLDTRVSDHQCGAKAFSSRVLERQYSSDGWFWDTEFLFRAKRRGYCIEEVPIDFERSGDEGSVYSMMEELGVGLFKLWWEKSQIDKYLRFIGVGAVGAVVNQLFLLVLTELTDLHYLISAAAGIEAAILVMFFLNNRLTFESDLKSLKQTGKAIITSNMVRSLGVAAQLCGLYVLTEFAGIHYFISNIVAIGLASFLTFKGEYEITWDEDNQSSVAPSKEDW